MDSTTTTFSTVIPHGVIKLIEEALADGATLCLDHNGLLIEISLNQDNVRDEVPNVQ